MIQNTWAGCEATRPVVAEIYGIQCGEETQRGIKGSKAALISRAVCQSREREGEREREKPAQVRAREREREREKPAQVREREREGERERDRREGKRQARWTAGLHVFGWV